MLRSQRESLYFLTLFIFRSMSLGGEKSTALNSAVDSAVNKVLCTSNSCLMVFTVHGICTAQGLYVLPRVEVHTARGRYYPMCCKKTQLIDRIRLTTGLASAPECPYYTMYCVPSVEHEVPYAVAILL